MEHQTIKNIIRQFIHQQPREYVFGGVIEDYLRTTIGTKGESTSRICRMMVKDGTLDPIYVPRKGGRSNVAYKLNPLSTLASYKIDQFPTKKLDQAKLLNIPASL